MILFFGNQRVEEWNIFIQQEQAITDGNVVERYTDTSGDDNSYIIRYRFSIPGVANGFQNESQEVDQATFDSIPDGSIVSITYLPVNPQFSWITGHDRYSDPNPKVHRLLLYSGVATLVTLGWAVHYIWRKRRLARGRLIQGKVTGWDFEEQATEDGTAIVDVMLCQFENPQGKTITIKKIHKDETYHPERGTPLAILYVDDKFYEML